MIYKNSDIPDNFNKIAEISDNYVVFVRENTLNSGTSYQAYIQYFNPSYQYFFTDNYKIKSGTSYSLDYNYYNSGMGSYLDSADINYQLSTITTTNDYISSEDKDKPDTITIFLGQILVCICMLWIFKQISHLFYRGGLS